MELFEKYFQFVLKKIDEKFGNTMRDTTENSQWHREENVFVHTQMVMSEFMKLANEKKFSFDKFRLGLIACAFHDVGKPMAKQPHPDGGFSFYNHEVMSANIFRNLYHTDSEVSAMVPDPAEYLFVRFMIQVHLPFKTQQFLKILKQSVIYYGEQAGLSTEDTIEVFTTVLRADAMGRISDDHQEKLKNLNAWIADFTGISCQSTPTKKSQFEVICFSGAMGAGKSTQIKQAMEICDQSGELYLHFSFDDERAKIIEKFEGIKPGEIVPREVLHKYAGHLNGEFTRFAKECRTKFGKIVKERSDQPVSDSSLVVFVDATFTTRKTRLLVKNSFQNAMVSFVEIDLPFKTHLDQNSKRIDSKYVPVPIVTTSYYNTTLPMIDEMDF